MREDSPSPTPAPADNVPASARRFGRDLTVGSIPRHLLVFALPMLAGSVLQTAYMFVNLIWVGRWLGSRELAALGTSMPVLFVLFTLAAGMTMASTVLISQHFGAGDLPAVRRVVVNSSLLIGGLSVVLLAAGELAAEPILRLMNAPPEVLGLSVAYLRILLISFPFGFGMFLMRNMLQGIGDSRTPLYFLAGSVVLTAALDPVLMFGWLGAPKLGLNGTAWAATIAQCLAMVALATTLRRQKNLVAPTLSPRQFHGPTFWATIRIGLPSAAQQMMVSISMVVVTGIVNQFGKPTIAAFGAATRGIDQWAFLPAMTFSMSVTTLAGQNIGAGRYDRVRSILLWGCLLSGGITLCVSAAAVGVPALLMRIFTDDAEVIRIGCGYLRIVGFGYVLFSVMFVINGILNGAGRTLVTAALTLLTLWIVRVPTAIVLCRMLGRVEGVWYAIVLSFSVAMLGSLGYYCTGWWRRPILRKILPIQTSASMVGDQAGEA